MKPVTYVTPSDDLLRLRELFIDWPPVLRLLEVMPPVRLVIDTNVVIEDLLWRRRQSHTEAEE